MLGTLGRAPTPAHRPPAGAWPDLAVRLSTGGPPRRFGRGYAALWDSISMLTPGFPLADPFPGCPAFRARRAKARRRTESPSPQCGPRAALLLLWALLAGCGAGEKTPAFTWTGRWEKTELEGCYHSYIRLEDGRIACFQNRYSEKTPFGELVLRQYNYAT